MIMVAQHPASIQRSEIIEEIGGKPYYIHLVRQGQTIQAIADTYNVSVAEINSENPRFNGEIGSGAVIKIPKHEKNNKSSEQTTSATVATPDKSQKNDASAGNTKHTVLAKETFFGIARQYKITVPQLMAANPGIESLQPGQVLYIPTQEKNQPGRSTQITSSNQNNAEPDHHLPASYKVQAGETLFSISKEFGLQIEELLKLNPELKEGLKAGQTIFLNTQNNNTDQFIQVKDTIVSYTYHKVRRGETLFGIGREYGISVDIILEYNPHVTEGLQPRQVLKIPVYDIKTKRIEREIIPVKPAEIPLDTIAPVFPADCHPMPDPGKVYNIALMLPFFIEPQPVSQVPDSLDTILEANPYRSYEFMQFYYGAMLAIDSLKNLGLNARVFVYDVDNTPESILKVLEEPELPDMDIIIGPLLAAGFDQVAKFARERQIRIVNPLSSRSEFLVNNPYAIKARPTAKDQVSLIISYIKNHYPDHNIIVVRQYSFSEANSLDLFKREFSEFDFNEVIFIRDSLEGIRRNLDSLHQNIVIGLSTDNVFAMDLVRKLNDIRSEYPLTCFGLQQWEDFALDTDHIVNLNLHLPSSNFIDYNSEQVKQFISAFRKKYDTEPLPNRFAFSAFDVTWYFVNAMITYGEAFDECLPSFLHRGLEIPFDFETHDRHGMENKGLTIYRFQDFGKKEVYPNHF